MISEVMKFITTLLHGILLAAAIFLLMGFVIGASGYLYESGAHPYAIIPYVTGMVVLALLGFILRRWVWPEGKKVWKIMGAGFLSFILLQLALVLFTSGSRELAEVPDSVNMVMWLYVLWFWVPFAIGILSGGFRRKTRHSDPSEHPTLV